MATPTERGKSAGGRVARGCAAHTIPHRPIGVAMGGWNKLGFGIRTPGHPDIHESGSVTDGANLEGKCAVLVHDQKDLQAFRTKSL